MILDTRDLLEEGDEEIAALVEEIERYSGDRAEDGIALIPDDEFEDYARELAEDLGLVTARGWPSTCIDWVWVADDLKVDYTSVTFRGVVY